MSSRYFNGFDSTIRIVSSKSCKSSDISESLESRSSSVVESAEGERVGVERCEV